MPFQWKRFAPVSLADLEAMEKRLVFLIQQGQNQRIQAVTEELKKSAAKLQQAVNQQPKG